MSRWLAVSASAGSSRCVLPKSLVSRIDVLSIQDVPFGNPASMICQRVLPAAARLPFALSLSKDLLWCLSPAVRRMPAGAARPLRARESQAACGDDVALYLGGPPCDGKGDAVKIGLL